MGTAAPSGNTVTGQVISSRTGTQIPADRQLAVLQAYSENPDAVSAGLTGAGGVKVEEEGGGAPDAQRPEGGSTPNIPGAPEPPTVPVNNVKEAAKRAPMWVGALPSPGTILFPLLIVIFFWIAIEKVNGKSRWQWLWDVLTGNAAVQTTAAASTAPAGGVLATGTGTDPALLAAFRPDSGLPSTTAEVAGASTFQPTFTYVPSSRIAVTD